MLKYLLVGLQREQEGQSEVLGSVENVKILFIYSKLRYYNFMIQQGSQVGV